MTPEPQSPTAAAPVGKSPLAQPKQGGAASVATPQRKTAQGAQKVPSATVAVPLQRGQDVVARCAGSWREAVVVRPPRGRGAVGVVDTETWTERQVALADVAIKASLACALRKSPKAATSAAKTAAAERRAVRSEERAAKALSSSVPARAPSPDAAVGDGLGQADDRAKGSPAAAAAAGAAPDGTLPAASAAATDSPGRVLGRAPALAAQGGAGSPEPALVLKRSRCRPEKAGLDTKALKKADEVLHAKVTNIEMPGVVSVVYRHGALAHLDCHGYADLERKTPMRPDTIVRLYSMTKCIVSVAVAVCLEDGLLQLDDLVSKFIPSFANVQVRKEGEELQPAERPITVLHLLTHTAGLGYGPMLGDEADGEAEERFIPLIERSSLGRTSPNDPRAIKSLEQWCDELAKVPLQSQPGTEWFYSYSHDVVGRVIEVATGQRLDAFLQRRVLGPLAMVDTGFEVPREKWDRVAGMYRRFEVEAPSSPSADASETKAAAADGMMQVDEPSSPRTTAASAGSPGPTATEEGPSPAASSPPAAAASASSAAAAAERAEAAEDAEAAGKAEEEDNTVYELRRLDKQDAASNEWLAGNASPILAGGGSVDAMTGGLVSTAADYARFCLMLLRKGELDGVRVLRPETVKLLTTNQLPRATGRDDAWAFSTPGVGFGLLGSVSVEHPELDSALRPGEYGWGGMAGTAWTNDPTEDFFLLSFSLTAFDLTTEEELRAGVRTGIAQFNERRENVERRRMEKLEKEQRRLERLQAASSSATAVAPSPPQKAAGTATSPGKSPTKGLARLSTPTKRSGQSPAEAGPLKKKPRTSTPAPAAAGAVAKTSPAKSPAAKGAAASPAARTPPSPSPQKQQQQKSAQGTGGSLVGEAVGNPQPRTEPPSPAPTRGASAVVASATGGDAASSPPQRRVRLRLDRGSPSAACTVST